MMKQVFALASTALLAFAASWLALASLRPAAPAASAGPPDPAPASAEEPNRLMDRIAARLDEVGQVEDDLNDQKTAVAKAELALTVARREAEIADLAVREYDEATYPQELALAEGELALAEGEYRLLEGGPRPAAPPPTPRDPDRPESKPSTAAEPQALARARLALDLARAHRDALVRRTRPRRSAELKKEVERAQGELKLKQAALDQERADLTRLERQLKAASLSAEERQAMAILQEGSGGPSPSRIDRAAALSAQAERRRAEALQAEALDRVRRALEDSASP